MPDLGSSSFDEVDANNDEASPNGFPTAMAPSGVDNSARAVMGAVKRFWNRSNAVKTTGGTTSAFTLTYDQAATAYYDGEIISFVVNATNAADATINVNALGAKALRLFGGNLLAGALVADQIAQARYSSSAGAFDLIPQNGWVRLGTQSPSGASTVDFEDIPAAVNHLMVMVELDPSVDGASISMRTYGADGVLDSGASDYYYIVHTATTAAVANVTAATTSSILLASDVDNASNGFGARIEAANIQAATFTKFTYQTTYVNSNGTTGVHISGTGVRNETDRITGVRFLPSSGTVTGRVTLFGSA